MNKSFTTKLIVLLISWSTAILIAGMAISNYFSEANILNHLEEESQTSINSTVTSLENWLNSIESATLFFGRILEQHEHGKTSLDGMLRDAVDKNHDIFGAAIALNPALTDNPQGYAPYYYKDKNKGLSFSDLASGSVPYWKQPWYAEAVKNGKPTWIEPYFDTGGAEIFMTTYSVPMYRRDIAGKESLYGVVTADVALEVLDEFMQRLRQGSNGISALLSRGGIFLSSKDPSDIMQHYLDVDLVEYMVEDNVLNSLFERAIAGGETSGKISCPLIPGDCIITASTLHSTGWPVAMLYSEDEYLAPLRQYQTSIFILILLLLLVMALMIAIVSRRLTRPLAALATATDKISHGDLDAELPEVGGEDEIARLVNAFGTMKTNLKTYIKNLETATAARSRMEGELAVAKEIQMAMLPHDGEAWEQTPTFSLWAKVLPAKTVGGDLFTFYQDSNERLFFAVGDVSDKGVPAALFMAKTLSHIQQYSEAFTKPARGMALLNNALASGNSSCMFVTLFFGVLDLTSGELLFVSAGHTAPCLLRDGICRPLDQKSNAALGLTPNAQYLENHTSLLPGDRLVIYTDGVDEAFNEDNEMYSSERLQREIEQNQGYNIAELGEHVLHSLDEFAGNRPQSDDISLMLLQFSQQSAVAKIAPVYGRFSEGPGVSTQVNTWLTQRLKILELANAPLMELLLVSEEITTNIAKHGKLARESVIELLLEKSGDDISLEFRDSGISFNPLEGNVGARLVTDIQSAGIGGLGIHLITGLTQQQEYRRDGEMNIFRVTKTLP